MTPINLFPNAMTTAFRETTRDGKKYLVVNGVPIREQVLNYYLVPTVEINHFIEAWNGVPVTIHHAAQNKGSANVPVPKQRGSPFIFPGHAIPPGKML
jgi:hypothetical protein